MDSHAPDPSWGEGGWTPEHGLIEPVPDAHPALTYRLRKATSGFLRLTGLSAGQILPHQPWAKPLSESARLGVPRRFQIADGTAGTPLELTVHAAESGSFLCLLGGPYRNTLPDRSPSAAEGSAGSPRSPGPEAERHQRTLEAILESALAGYWEYDIPRESIVLSRSLRRMLGLPHEEGPQPLAGVLPLLAPGQLDRLREAGRNHLASRGAVPLREEILYRLHDGSEVWVLCAGHVVEWNGDNPVRLAGCQVDITDRKRNEAEQSFTVDLLRLLNQPSQTRELVREVTRLLQSWSQCEAVGVRLEDRGDFTYYETRGFPQDFVEAERYLCGAGGGLDCLCGAVLEGRCQAPSGMFSAQGSFVTGQGGSLLPAPDPQMLPRGFRGRCLTEGYETLVLVPLRTADRTIGLLQINDRRPDRISARQLALLETLANSLALALEHRQAQKHLQESRERFSLAIDAVSDGLFDWNIATGDAFFSDRYWTMLGYAPGSQPASRETFESFLLHPEDRPHFQRIMREYFEGTREAHETEFRLRTAGGGWRWVLSRGRLVSRDAQGKPLRMLGTHVDIEERRHAEQALIENERLLREAQEVARLGTYVMDIAAGTWTSSGVLDEIFGIDADFPRDVEGWGRILHPEWREKMLRYLAEDVFARRGRFDIEYPIIRWRDGEERWVHGVGRLDLDGEGRPVRMIGTIRDITDSRRAEELLRKSEEKFRGMAEQLAEVLFTSDSGGAFTYVSPAASSVFGLPPEQMLGRRLDEFLAGGEEAPAWDALQPARAVRVTLKRCDGTHFPGEVSSAPLAPASPGSGFVGLIRDITARVATEEQLRQAQKMESIGRLAGGVAHDFNNLLTVINGYCDLLLGGKDVQDPSRKLLTAIRSAGGRAADLTKQLLTYSRRQAVELKPLSLNHLVEENQDLLARMLGEDIGLRLDLAPDAPPVLADADQMHQVIMNLASNARDAMPRGGELRFTTDFRPRCERCPFCEAALAPGDFTRLTVRDNGIGMDRHTLANLFEPFFTTKPVGRGTGLGMAAVHGVVQQSRGHICVQSEPGVGTEFHLLLPAIQAPDAASPAEEPVPPEGGTETVLVVEDQTEVRDFIAEVLRGYGYRVLRASSGVEALGLLEESPVDLLLTDVIMAGMSGVELATQARRRWPATRVLYVSGYSADKVDEEHLAVEGTYFLAKPFMPRDLAATVREALRAQVRKARILVVDDEDDVRGYFRAVLERAGYEVEEAADGALAQRSLAASSFDLVLTDLIMPNQEGIETIRQMRKRWPGIGIVAVSGTRWGAFLEVARALGADASLSKPVDAAQLTQEIGRVLAARARKP